MAMASTNCSIGLPFRFRRNQSFEEYFAFGEMNLDFTKAIDKHFPFSIQTHFQCINSIHENVPRQFIDRMEKKIRPKTLKK